jgi:hypothetical protein
MSEVEDKPGAEDGDRAEAAVSPVAAYKAVLRKVLDSRPSGTRQRLAATLGKNRSFVSQIANPAYPVPIPAQHIDAMFEVCHFSQEERRTFLDLYAKAHPHRVDPARRGPRMRTITLSVPDLQDARKNRVLDEMVVDVVRRLMRAIDDIT